MPQEFAEACQRSILELIIPRLMETNNNLIYTWPCSDIDWIDWTRAEIDYKDGSPIAMFCFDNLKLHVLNYSDPELEHATFYLADPEIQDKAYHYTQSLINSYQYKHNLCHGG